MSTNLAHVQADDKQPMSRLKKALIVLAIIALILVAAVVALFFYIRVGVLGQLVTLDDPFPETEGRPAVEEETDTVNFLILGSDSRISGGDPTYWEQDAQRTDTMILAQLSEKNNTLTVMSIPRDSWVDVPSVGMAKINAAYANGGPKLTIETVETVTGVRIDHFLLVDFTTFKRLTDKLGGVTVNAVYWGGMKTLNGEEALAFVRERQSLEHGDFSRVLRQQEWIRAIMSKVFNEGVLYDPQKTLGLIETVASDTAVDDSLGIPQMMEYAKKARNIRPDNVIFITAPWTGTGWSPDGRQSIVNLDYDKFGPLMNAWKEDNLKQFLDENQDDYPKLGSMVW
ncbi:MAG: LCP family protein [Actinomycetaceae bacterium]|nr:LCP family protein [Actinomycetaceae bacterium]